MRSLAQTKVLIRAGIATLVTSLICCPRLALWTERVDSVFYLWLILLLAMFVMWGFVFAWHEPYSKRPPLNFDFKPGIWAVGTLTALLTAAAYHYHFDPRIRLLAPADYPHNLDAWVALTLFQLGFEPLFFCFAPFAFFIRLTRRHEASVSLTVLFGVFVLVLRLNSFHTALPFALVLQMILLRAVSSFVTIYFYLKAGAFIIGWLILLVQLRLLIDLSAIN